jgi:hypothetical protein|tara:strand:- start:704 stop:934 length:231 start_codon:yes stop_codon:yes gene_type:complete
MRYKEGEIPKEQLAVHASDAMLLLTAFIGVLIGIALTVLGRKGKQMWMWVWGLGLVACSFYLGVSIAFDVRLFGHF